MDAHVPQRARVGRMNEAPKAPVPPGDDEPVELRSFFLAALLWLPLAFFLWYVLRTVVVFPVLRLAGWALSAWMPELFGGFGQTYEIFNYSVLARLAGVTGLPGATLEVTLDVNTLQYCYGTAMLFGLVMATPLDWPHTFRQLAVGWLLLIPFQAFGVAGEMLRDVGYSLGSAVATGLASEGHGAVAQAAGNVAEVAASRALLGHGLSPELIGLWYQFGYLILPAVAPVVIWIVLNRRFIEKLADPRPQEPPPPAGGQSTAT
jgi:hypothetical protein